MASLDSDVYGTHADAMCSMMTMGPTGIAPRDCCTS